MVCAQIIIPLQDNNGHPTPESLITAWCIKARNKFGGCTFRRRSVEYFEGALHNYCDPVGVLEIDISDTSTDRASVKNLAKLVKHVLDQESVYVRFTAVEAGLV